MCGVSLSHSGLHTGVSDDPHQARASPEEDRLHAGIHPGHTHNTHARTGSGDSVSNSSAVSHSQTSEPRDLRSRDVCRSNSGTNTGYSPGTGKKEGG